MMKKAIQRLSFICGGVSAALATAATGCRLFAGAAKDCDENLTVFLADRLKDSPNVVGFVLFRMSGGRA